MGLLDKIFGSYSDKELKRIEPKKQAVIALEPKYKAMSDKELQGQTAILKERLAKGETPDDILPDAFAVCREAMYRTIGIKPYPVQILGGIVLHQGRIAEMKTGEGKTFVAALPSYLNALSGKGVHVVTVNDYLAKYGSEQIGRVHRFLGLSVGLIYNDMPNDERRRAYDSDVTYATNNELGFDYLRDNMCVRKEDKVQRGFSFGIVDEVDSILIDEARTPLIISGRGEKSTDLYERANRFAKTLNAHKVVELDNKEDHDELYRDCDYIIDEKAKTATLMPKGVEKAEAYFGLNIEKDDENEDNGEAETGVRKQKSSPLMDAENLTLLHHVNQAVKAHGIMKLDVDYVVKDGEIIIVDEFTGRLMFGRRFNEGLHQAIEAKESVKIKNESKTLATITFQNFFRLYEKLSGMTGTAMTEEQEFRGIYNLDVISVPTNMPVARTDHQDQVYKNEAGKFKSVIDRIEECNAKGQPVLVGTVSIEKSELLSKMLRKKGVKHNVLNAKFHEQEAEIIAQAGKKSAVTIATNMAGRGTDIMLGGNAEYLARAKMKKEGFEESVIFEAMGFAETDDPVILAAREKYKVYNEQFKQEIIPKAEEVKKAGGLFVIGTERHEARRIDNQLRGRSGRQGDPGESCFYISLEDDLMRIFGGERIQKLMETLKIEEDQPIEGGILTKTIERSQRQIEGRNYSIRKNVLDFDDVMNQQRTTIYEQRGKVLDGGDVSGNIKAMIKDTVIEAVNTYCQGDSAENWNLIGLREAWIGIFTQHEDFMYTPEELEELEHDGTDSIKKLLLERAEERYNTQVETVTNDFGADMMREIERSILLRNVDEKWMEHIDAMSDLKNGVYMRSMGAHVDPVVEYRHEGFAMYDEMIAAIREDTVRMVLAVQVKRNSPPPHRTQVFHPEPVSTGPRIPRTVKKVGANELCPCGSGKKYKKCCGNSQ